MAVWGIRRDRLQSIAAVPIPMAVLVPVLVTAAFVAPGFYTASNLGNLSQQITVLGLLTAGQFLVLLVGGLDLSVSAVAGIAAVILSRSAAASGPGFVGLLAVALIIGAVIGLVNGLLVVKRGVPAFIVTLGMFVLLGGARLAYTGGAFSGTVPTPVRWLATATLGPISLSVLTLIVVYGALAYMLYFTAYGRRVYATGTNRDAAWIAGVPTEHIVLSAFVLCSVLAVLAGWSLTAYVGYVDQNLGTGSELDSIAAALIGGASFVGGQGNLIGVLTGAILVSVLVNLVVVIGLELQWQDIVKAVVVLVAVALGAVLRRAS